MFDELGVPIKPQNPPLLLKMSLLENPLVTDGFLSCLNLYLLSSWISQTATFDDTRGYLSIFREYPNLKSERNPING